MDVEKIEQGVRLILEGLGEDLEREGLKNTPLRVARMYQEIFCGLSYDPLSVLGTIFVAEEQEEMILVKDIPLYSMCEHHLLPFYGKAHVAYIPRKGRITGLSKIARVVEILAKRPQMQERLTSQIADTLVRGLDPRGVLVVVEAEHMCMTMRGVRKPGSKTVTSAVRGLFRASEATRAEAFSLIKGA
ncbi:MAG: GTP cyclohydrolase I FolE [Clostridia bacterium]|nr:GTP cyclohydrolase I FolE [Clostridia bacterium]